jgi:hypothetical protein
MSIAIHGFLRKSEIVALLHSQINVRIGLLPEERGEPISVRQFFNIHNCAFVICLYYSKRGHCGGQS